MTALTSNQVANYGAYFDWNGDGVFGPGEGYTGQIGTIATPTETKVISVSVPCTAVQIVYMRFRLAQSAAEVRTGYRHCIYWRSGRLRAGSQWRQGLVRQ